MTRFLLNVGNILSRNKATLITLFKGFVLFRCNVGCLFKWLKMFVYKKKREKHSFLGINVIFTNDEFRYENTIFPHTGAEILEPCSLTQFFRTQGLKNLQPFIIARMDYD